MESMKAKDVKDGTEVTILVSSVWLQGTKISHSTKPYIKFPYGWGIWVASDRMVQVEDAAALKRERKEDER